MAKNIKPGEEFILHNTTYTYSVSADTKSIELVKVREIKQKQVKPAFIPPTLDDVKAYFKEKGYSEEIAIKAYEFYEASEPPWHDSTGKSVKMWKQKMLNNWFKPEHKIKIEKQKSSSKNIGQNLIDIGNSYSK